MAKGGNGEPGVLQYTSPGAMRRTQHNALLHSMNYFLIQVSGPASQPGAGPTACLVQAADLRRRDAVHATLGVSRCATMRNDFGSECDRSGGGDNPARRGSAAGRTSLGLPVGCGSTYTCAGHDGCGGSCAGSDSARGTRKRGRWARNPARNGAV